MGQMLVRNLDDAVIERLKRKALERGTSLEQVAREALAAAAVDTDRQAWVARMDALRAEAPPSDTSSVELIREMREERDRQLMGDWDDAPRGNAPKGDAPGNARPAPPTVP
jgi:plasmid stability protein